MLQEFRGKYRDSEKPLKTWYRIAKAARWRNFADVRNTYNSADQISKEGKHYIIFKIGDDVRMVVGVNYATQILYTIRVMTHDEYDQGKWKALL